MFSHLGCKVTNIFPFHKELYLFFALRKREADFIFVANLPKTQNIFLPLIKNTAFVNVQQNLCRVERKLLPFFHSTRNKSMSNS